MHLYFDRAGNLLGGRRATKDHRIHVAPDDETVLAWGREFALRWFPEDNGHAISEVGIDIIWDEIEPVHPTSKDVVDITPHYRAGPRGLRFIRCTYDFREFLKVWYFESNYKKAVMTLGQGLWPGQDMAVTAMEKYPRCFFLKARRLGETTLAVAYDAWILCFTPSSRVHLISRIEKDAKDSLLKPLKFGISRLPEEMRLPVGTDTTTVLELRGGPDDRRVVEAFAAKEPGRGYGATHVHLDEWAAMMETSPELPEDVWKAIAPTLNPDSSLHVLTTGKGPGFYAEKWEEALKGEGKPDEEGIPTLYACFIRATGSRPDYTPERIKRERAESGAWEYPEKWQEAIAGKEGNYFTEYEIDWAHKYARGYIAPIFQRGQGGEIIKIRPHGRYLDKANREHTRRFLKAWDIGGPGEDSDASCGLLLDVTEAVWDVRKIVYVQGTSYPDTAKYIEDLHLSYPGDTWIEDNNAGLAVRQFLMLPEHQVHGWKTTGQSKPVALRGLKAGLQYRLLKWDPEMENANVLDAEMRRYQLKDVGIKQDTVMALSIAVAVGPEVAAEQSGKVIRLFGGGLTLT